MPELNGLNYGNGSRISGTSSESNSTPSHPNSSSQHRNSHHYRQYETTTTTTANNNMAAEFDQENMGPEIKVKTVYLGQVMVIYVKIPTSMRGIEMKIKEVYNIMDGKVVTLKWIDDEGDPCTLSSDQEVSEALRLHRLNNDSELTIHAFDGKPQLPGMSCTGEDKHVYRQGARRWNKNKIYNVNGHKFTGKRFNKKALCQMCQSSIFGIGWQGMWCITCKLAVHKRCHRLIRIPCDADAHHSQHHLPPSYPGSEQGGFVNPVGPDDDEKSRDGGSGGGPPRVGEIEDAQVESGGPKWHVGLDDFNLLTVIGRGSYAKVIQVEQKSTGQIYAMKIIKKEMFLEDEDIDWVQTEKSVFEIATNYPFLVGLHSCFQSPSRLFFVLEFVAGGDLMFHMQKQKRLPEEHARFYSSEIVLALHYLHAHHIIYRDLKLDNVLIDMEGHIKLTDYGMCKENIHEGDVTSTFCGTPNYIAPEILEGKEYGFSVDWWALGVLMYEMMAGRSPFDVVGMSDNPDTNSEDYLFQVILQKQIRVPRTLSVKASGVLKKFLNKDPTKRLGCVGNVQEGFEEIKNENYFKTVDWDLLEQKQIPPPYKPSVANNRDLSHFDQQFTDEQPQLTPDDPSVISRIEQTEFEGFEYINPLLMSQDDAV